MLRNRRAPWALVVASVVLISGAPLIQTTASAAPDSVLTFADEDRSAELVGQRPHQQYQFSSPTTVTYDQDTLTSATSARIYVADVGQHVIRVLDLNGRQIGQLDETSVGLDPQSPASEVPAITAPLGIAFLSASVADDPRLAGLYVNDVGAHRIHFFRTDPDDPNVFMYVTSVGAPGEGGGEEMNLPRNLTVLPQGLLFVSDEFNHRLKGFALDPDDWTVSLVTTEGHSDGQRHVPAGPILPGQDNHFGADSEYYEDYSESPDKIHGFRIPQGQTYWRSPTERTFLFVADNGNNRIKIYEVDEDGTLELVDMLSRIAGGDVSHLKRPRGVRVDHHGNLFIADTYGGRILRVDNLDDSGGVQYRLSRTDDAETAWEYGRMGIHQIEMRSPATALVEDAAFQLPNDAVPLLTPDGQRYTENVTAWGLRYQNAPVVLVSDTGNHRIKKCWEHPDEGRILRCSVSAGVGSATHHEFWGHPRTLDGQLHYASAIDHVSSLDSSEGTILVSDTPNSVIESFSEDGEYLGSFTGSQLSWGVTGIASFRGHPGADDRRVAALVASDATLPWPYTGDSSLRLYRANGQLARQFNLTSRTAGHDAPRISFLGSNMPVAVAVTAETDARFAVFVTTSANYLWRFTYDTTRNSLTADWVVGGSDPSKGIDGSGEWAYGSAFFLEGTPGTFDQIQDVTVGQGRVYATDRRNQRIQVFDVADGTYVGRIGAGGGTYDHPTSLSADEFFLPHGIHLDDDGGRLLVGDGFNFVARLYGDPSGIHPDSEGQMHPDFLGHWSDPAWGTRDGGLFATQNVLTVGAYVYVDSLISNRITRSDAADFTPVP